MQVDKNSIGKKLYIIETRQDSTVVAHYGELISILPKYMFLDKFSSKYSREQTFLFRCKTHNREGKINIINITVSDAKFIFESFFDMYDCFKGENILFGESIIIKAAEGGYSEFEI